MHASDFNLDAFGVKTVELLQVKGNISQCGLNLNPGTRSITCWLTWDFENFMSDAWILRKIAGYSITQAQFKVRGIGVREYAGK